MPRIWAARPVRGVKAAKPCKGNACTGAGHGDADLCPSNVHDLTKATRWQQPCAKAQHIPRQPHTDLETPTERALHAACSVHTHHVRVPAVGQ